MRFARRPAPLTLALIGALLLCPVGQAQGVDPGPLPASPPQTPTPQAPAPQPPAPITPPAPAAAPATRPTLDPPSAGPQLLLTAPADTVREYRLSALSQVSFSVLDAALPGAEPGDYSAALARVRAALQARSRPQSVSSKQFIKVLPGEEPRIALSSIFGSGPEATTLRLTQVLRPGQATLPLHQPDPALSAPAAQVEQALAGAQAELVAPLSPASYGLWGAALGGAALAGAGSEAGGLSRRVVLRVPNPLASPGADSLEVQPIVVEQRLRFEGLRGDEWVFSRSARIVQPQQTVAGRLTQVVKLLSYEVTGELVLSSDGLPVRSSFTETYRAEVRGRAPQPGAGGGERDLDFAFVVSGGQTVTLVPFP